jgi:hypothetical protein
MLYKSWNKISTIIIFLVISLLLFNVYPIRSKQYIIQLPLEYKIKSTIPIDPIMKDIYVPPDQNSHPKFYQHNGKIGYSKTWQSLQSDNNIPGILPGPRPGNMLGLNNNSSLSLLTPIKAPLLDNVFPSKCNSEGSYMNQVKDDLLKGCLLEANEKSKFNTLPASLYYKYRFQQCNPYNGSYCQCTNNYIPLPPIGYCQQNGWNEDVCPYKYRIKPSSMYSNTQKFLEKQFYK